MKRILGTLALCATALAPAAAGARGLGVEVWTDRGHEAVYQPGDGMNVEVRASDDSYLLVYEIDTEGYVRVLHPYQGRAPFVEGGRTLTVPDPRADVELVVQQTVGQSYIVAIAALDPFRALPWYLRPHSAQAEALGYLGELDDDEGITAEGRIVGDPFVAMERIRRRVLADPDDDEAFATAYTSYYVHAEVKYPRYLCYDCHRPDRWAWWDGFDPYYADCSVFRFRVNWSWYWGPSYWFGHVPHFVYVYRPDCPPRYRRHFEAGIWHSAWDGWNRWCEIWGAGGLRRYKTAPPASYVPPQRWKDAAVRLPAGRATPPGFLVAGSRHRDAASGRLPIGRSRPADRDGRGFGDGRTRWTQGADRPGAPPAGEREGRAGRERGERRPADRPRREEGGAREARDRRDAPEARPRERRDETPRVRETRPERRDETPRVRESAPPRRDEGRRRLGFEPGARFERPAAPAARFEPAPRFERPAPEARAPRFERSWTAPARPAPEAPRTYRPDPPARESRSAPEAPRVERREAPARPEPAPARPSRSDFPARRERR